MHRSAVVLRPVGIDLSPSAIAMLDTAYLGFLGMYGQFPKSIKSVLFTGAMYGLPALFNVLGMEDRIPAIQHFPKYASRLGMLYSGVSSMAVLLVVLACIPMCYKLMSSEAVQDVVHQAVETGKQSLQQAADGATTTRSGASVSKGGSATAYHVDDDGVDADDDENEDEEEEEEEEEEETETVPLKKQQQPQARATRQGKTTAR